MNYFTRHKDNTDRMCIKIDTLLFSWQAEFLILYYEICLLKLVAEYGGG
jgi:hypothetical protein